MMAVDWRRRRQHAWETMNMSMTTIRESMVMAVAVIDTAGVWSCEFHRESRCGMMDGV